MNQESQNNTLKSWARVLSQKEDLGRLFKDLKMDNYQDINQHPGPFRMTTD